MQRSQLDHIEAWVFDLDNTLYPASCKLFAQVDHLMMTFIGVELGLDLPKARELQKNYFREYGTTLRGLMINHDVEPQAFMEYVHDIDHSVVPPNPALERVLARLPGRKLIFTNGSVRHAEKVTERVGIGHHFEAIFDIAAAHYVPKPDIASYRTLVREHDLDPSATVMVEDIARNLIPAASMGMTTVWVETDSPYGRVDADGEHIHHVANDLVAWLERAIGP